MIHTKNQIVPHEAIRHKRVSRAISMFYFAHRHGYGGHCKSDRCCCFFFFWYADCSCVMLIETRDSNGDDDDDADGVWKRSFHGIRLTLFLSLRLRHRHRQLPDANKCYSNPPAYCYIFLQ